MKKYEPNLRLNHNNTNCAIAWSLQKNFKTTQMVIIIIIHILSVYFPCLHGLDKFLNGNLPFSSICTRSWSVFREWKSLSTTRYQVFQNLPFLCCPLTTISLYFCTMWSSLHLSTWPNHLNLSLLIQFLMLSRPKHSLCSYPSRWHHTSILYS